MKGKIGLLFLLPLVLLLSGFAAVSDGTSSAAGRAQIDLTYNGRTYRYTDEYIAPTDHLVAEELQNRKINAATADKIRMVDKVLSAGADYKKAMLYPFPLLYKTVDKIIKDINVAPVDSEISFDPSRRPMFSVTREKVGYEITEETLYREIYTYFKRGLSNPLPIRLLRPEVTSYDNLRATALRARFSTDYGDSSAERKWNIALALKKVSGTVVAPGVEFSFNKTVGPRTAANGFKVSKIIVGGEYVDGLGGGVCQASTTVYNTALLADLAIIQTSNHSLAPAYIKPSFDAMVNSGSSDLRFKNTGEFPIFIRAVGDGSRATVEIYGTPLPYRIGVESVVISESPPPPDKEEIDYGYKYLPPGSPKGERMRIVNAHGALRSEGYLIYRDLRGKFIERKLIRKDTYNGSAGTVMIAP